MIVGNIQLDMPSCVGKERRLAPGSSMQIDNQTSPRTLANDVKISAKMTSEKYTGRSNGENRHLQIELDTISTHAAQRNEENSLKKNIPFSLMTHIKWTNQDDENTERTYGGHEPEDIQ